MPDATTPNDPTLNPSLRSWVEAANDPASDFPIQNLPLCVFVAADDEEPEHDDHAGHAGHDHDDEDDDQGPAPRFGMAIGDSVVDVDMLAHAGVFDDSDEAHAAHAALHAPTLNALISDRAAMRYLRRCVQNWLLDTPPGGQQGRRLRAKAVLKQADVAFLEPVLVPNYTDFYASIHHARNVGAMFRPDNPLLPNYTHIPIGYHGRASSIVISGTDIRRPLGQTRADEASPPTFGPSQRLDYELEVGCVIGGLEPGLVNDLGESVSIDEAYDAIAGLLLVNDWSARDMQAWEYQPLGPFLAKNFATSISPFLVTREALAPFRVAGPVRDATLPEPLPYLCAKDRAFGLGHGTWDLTLEVFLASKAMRDKGLAPIRLSSGNLKDMFWTFSQMIAHHTSNGCNLLPGDLLASGTVSGAEPSSRGCMLELSWPGPAPAGKPPLPRTPIALPTGETRTFLQDHDEVIFKAFAQREGYRRIGFGDCRGTILPARTAR
jgi:fumarylacetoacetase